MDGGDDSENNYIGKRVLYPYLLSRGASKIDYIIISHFDSDHVKRNIYCH
ncbi:MAG: MBL fold metallo-hydrolase [Clostridia bacterium]|nr:MBL fold metallo-hydrolase [Clostridia bacterium]